MKTFDAAVIDTILPGEARRPNAAPLPSGSEVGLSLPAGDQRPAELLARLAASAGGGAAFVAAAPARRAELLAALEAERFAAFRALVAALLEDYYEAPEVLAAMGWRGGAAQPRGHLVPQADATTLRRLDRVRSRGPIWRKVR